MSKNSPPLALVNSHQLFISPYINLGPEKKQVWRRCQDLSQLQSNSTASDAAGGDMQSKIDFSSPPTAGVAALHRLQSPHAVSLLQSMSWDSRLESGAFEGQA